MSVKTSKETTDRQKAALCLLSVLTLRGPAVAAALAERFGPDEEAFRTPILGFVGALGEAVAELVAADEAHFAEKAVLATLRRRRDEATGHLTRLVVGLRRAVVALHVRPDLARLGFAAETPREPVPLLRQVDRIVATFENGPVGTLLGPPLFDHARLDPQGYPQPLRKQADALRGILAKVGEAQRRVEEALLRKRAARGEYDHLFLRSARIFENCCHLVGWTELAARIRPSRSRRGQTGQELTAEASGEVLGEVPDGAVAEEPLGWTEALRRGWAAMPVGWAGPCRVGRGRAFAARRLEPRRQGAPCVGPGQARRGVAGWGRCNRGRRRAGGADPRRGEHVCPVAGRSGEDRRPGSRLIFLYGVSAVGKRPLSGDGSTSSRRPSCLWIPVLTRRGATT